MTLKAMCVLPEVIFKSQGTLLYGAHQTASEQTKDNKTSEFILSIYSFRYRLLFWCGVILLSIYLLYCTAERKYKTIFQEFSYLLPEMNELVITAVKSQLSFNF